MLVPARCGGRKREASVLVQRHNDEAWCSDGQQKEARGEWRSWMARGVHLRGGVEWRDSRGKRATEKGRRGN
jgi:hypothetical protein